MFEILRVLPTVCLEQQSHGIYETQVSELQGLCGNVNAEQLWPKCVRVVLFLVGNRNSSVSVVSRVQTDVRGVSVRFLEGERHFCVIDSFQTRSMGTACRGVKLTSDHLLPKLE